MIIELLKRMRIRPERIVSEEKPNYEEPQDYEAVLELMHQLTQSFLDMQYYGVISSETLIPTAPSKKQKTVFLPILLNYSKNSPHFKILTHLLTNLEGTQIPNDLDLESGNPYYYHKTLFIPKKTTDPFGVAFQDAYLRANGYQPEINVHITKPGHVNFTVEEPELEHMWMIKYSFGYEHIDKNYQKEDPDLKLQIWKKRRELSLDSHLHFVSGTSFLNTFVYSREPISPDFFASRLTHEIFHPAIEIVEDESDASTEKAFKTFTYKIDLDKVHSIASYFRERSGSIVYDPLIAFIEEELENDRSEIITQIVQVGKTIIDGQEYFI